ncbi:MAG: hypothetical protein DRN26_03110 [Thermoplasmata archaeon]|nr:MAG: hypothetical protein DRN26_03110 [Thermoplasmata archaeon]
MIPEKQIENLIKNLVKFQQIGSEYLTSLLVEASKEVVKEEIKRELKEAFEKNETARRLLQRAVKDLIKSKALELRAVVLTLEALLEAGLTAIPEDVRKEMYKEIASYLYSRFKEMLEEGTK